MQQAKVCIKSPWTNLAHEWDPVQLLKTSQLNSPAPSLEPARRVYRAWQQIAQSPEVPSPNLLSLLSSRRYCSKITTLLLPGWDCLSLFIYCRLPITPRQPQPATLRTSQHASTQLCAFPWPESFLRLRADWFAVSQQKCYMEPHHRVHPCAGILLCNGQSDAHCPHLTRAASSASLHSSSAHCSQEPVLHGGHSLLRTFLRKFPHESCRNESESE